MEDRPIGRAVIGGYFFNWKEIIWMPSHKFGVIGLNDTLVENTKNNTIYKKYNIFLKMLWLLP